MTAISLDPSTKPDSVRFIIKYKSSLPGLNNEESTIVVDRIVIATGAASQKVVPNIEGIDNFKGDISHTNGFRMSALLTFPRT